MIWILRGDPHAGTLEVLSTHQSMNDAEKELRSGQVEGENLHLVSVRRTNISVRVSSKPVIEVTGNDPLVQRPGARGPRARSSTQD